MNLSCGPRRLIQHLILCHLPATIHTIILDPQLGFADSLGCWLPWKGTSPQSLLICLSGSPPSSSPPSRPPYYEELSGVSLSGCQEQPADGKNTLHTEHVWPLNPQLEHFRIGHQTTSFPSTQRQEYQEQE